jgi:hypothetical protein
MGVPKHRFEKLLKVFVYLDRTRTSSSDSEDSMNSFDFGWLLDRFRPFGLGAKDTDF